MKESRFLSHPPTYAYVAIGDEADPATLEETLAILDTLRVAPRD
jgi:hypothetical protein